MTGWDAGSAGIDPERVAELLVDLGGARLGRRGSGYRVSASAVLTTAHVVRDAAQVRVRFNADRPGEWLTEGTVAWSDATADAAVVTISPRSQDEDQVAPVGFGRVAERDAVLTCSAMGFPRFKLRNDPTQPLDDGSPSQYRDSAHAVGTIAVLANRREGTLEVTVARPERDPDPERSPWEGMSGAAVWSGGRIIGLVAEHHRADGLGRLTATRVDRWYERVPPTRLGELSALIGLPTVDELQDVVVPPAGRLVEGDDSVQLGPTHTVTAGFVAELERLRDEFAGLSRAEIERRADTRARTQDWGRLPDGVQSRILSGRETRPPDWDSFVKPFVEVCLEAARQNGVGVGPSGALESWHSLDSWQEYWHGVYYGGRETRSPLPERRLRPVKPKDPAVMASKQRTAATKAAVLDSTGILDTLRILYPRYDLVELFGVPMPICVFKAHPDEWTQLEAPLAKPLIDRWIPSEREYGDKFNPLGRPIFDRHLEQYDNENEEQRRSHHPGPTYALDHIEFDEYGRPRIHCVMGRYFTSLATSEHLDEELISALSMDPKRPVALAQHTLPHRAWLHGQLERQGLEGQDVVLNGRDRAAAMSHGTVIMLANEDGGYHVLLPPRSDVVATHPGFNHIAPSGILAPFTDELNPSPESEFSVLRNIYREYVEELYSYDQYERPKLSTAPDPIDAPEVTRLRQLLDSQEADLYYTGVSINLLTLRPEICTLLLIRQPDWLKQETRIAAAMGRPWRFSWEYVERLEKKQEGQPSHPLTWLSPDLQSWPTSSPLRPSFLVPNAAAAISLALDLLTVQQQDTTSSS
jgi:Trypsin-like peptidase domain